MKISDFLSENFHFLVVKFSVYLNRLVFAMLVKHHSETYIKKHCDESNERAQLLSHARTQENNKQDHDESTTDIDSQAPTFETD